MISKILPVAALAGAAMAATSCPLSLEISGTADHVAQVAITNTGAETLTLFKGNTVLSEHATLDVVAATGMFSSWIRMTISWNHCWLSIADKELEFKGTYVNYKRTGLAADMFQTLQPGETVTASLNVAKTYNLEGLETVDVTAIQGFRYVIGERAPSALSQTTLCDALTSNTVTITPDQSKVAS